MHYVSGRISGSMVQIGACGVLSMAVVMPSMAQERRVTQTAGVDNTKMGAYRALAQLSFQAFQNRDNVRAAELARILERTWDAAEEGACDRALVKTNKSLFEEIDKAMDVFIKPVMNYRAQAPNPAVVQAGYQVFVDKLAEGE
jgi:hypothetical protein